MFSTPWVPDENGNKMEIPRVLYPEIRKIIRNTKSRDKDKITYQITTQKDIDNFFQNSSK
jgi:hypothetical protein